MVDVLKYTNFFGKTKRYLYEYGKQVLSFGLDYAKILPGDVLLYSWKDRFGVVSLSDLQCTRKQKQKSLLKQNALYGFYTEWEGFTLLYNQIPFSNTFCLAFNNGEIRNFEGSVKCVTDNVIVYNQTYQYGPRVIIVNNGIQVFTLPSILDGKWADTFNLASEAKFNGNYIATRDELDAIMNYYTQVLKIDLQNYNKPTFKYVLSEKDRYVGDINVDKKLTMDKDCDVTPYKVKYDKYAFASLDEAKQNARNVLIYTKKRYLALLEAQEQQVLENKKREEEKEQKRREQEELKEKQQQEIDAACDELGSDL